MKKTAFVIWGDQYHPKEIYEEIIRQLFDNEKWELITTSQARDLLVQENKPDLVVQLAFGQEQGGTAFTGGEQERVRQLVQAGVPMLFVHAGLAGYNEDEPFCTLAGGRFISHPEPHNPVYCCALPGVRHPVLDGFTAFEAPDEHYFCHVDVDNVQPFLCVRSVMGTEIGGWTREEGKGRVCSITPGHNKEILAKMKPLLENAVRWCVREM